MMSLWDALRMNMMISYQELVRTFLSQLTSRHLLQFNTSAICKVVIAGRCLNLYSGIYFS